MSIAWLLRTADGPARIVDDRDPERTGWQPLEAGSACALVERWIHDREQQRLVLETASLLPGHAPTSTLRRLTDVLSSAGLEVRRATYANCLPALAQEFGVQNPPVWDSNTFDRAWVITYEGTVAVMRDLPQDLLPGDSTH